jgi:hypothetical protein
MNPSEKGLIRPEPEAKSAGAGGEQMDDSDRRRKARRTLLAVLAVCIAPVIASYTAYYFLPPGGRTNYGELLQPMQEVASVAIDPVIVPAAPPETRVLPIKASEATTLKGFAGRWVMVVIAPPGCDAGCQDRLYKIRQVRLTTGKHRNRVERLWLIPSGNTMVPDQQLLDDHAGMWVARVSPDLLAEHFPTSTSAAADHIYLMDPLNMLMMRFPVDADPSRMKKDLNKLLKASRIG